MQCALNSLKPKISCSIFFLFLSLATGLSAFAATDFNGQIYTMPAGLTYADTPGASYGKPLDSVSKTLDQAGFTHIDSNGKGETYLTWTDGIFTSIDFKQVVFLKFNVSLNDSRYENTLFSQKNGFFFHGMTADHIPYLLYFVGIESYAVRSLVSKIDGKIGTSSHAGKFKSTILKMESALVPSANAGCEISPLGNPLAYLQNVLQSDAVSTAVFSCLMPGWDIFVKQLKEHFVADAKSKFKSSAYDMSPLSLPGQIKDFFVGSYHLAGKLWDFQEKAIEVTAKMGKEEAKFLFVDQKVRTPDELGAALQMQMAMAIQRVQTATQNITSVIKQALSTEKGALEQWMSQPPQDKAKQICTAIGSGLGREAGNVVGLVGGSAVGIASWAVIPIVGEATGATKLVLGAATAIKDAMEAVPWAEKIVVALEKLISKTEAIQKSGQEGLAKVKSLANDAKAAIGLATDSAESKAAKEAAARAATRELPVQSQSALTKLVETKAPAVQNFVKDSPVYGYRITTDRFEDLPAAVRDSLGAVDKTKYTSEYLKQNIGSVIDIQMKDGKPEFYVVGKDTFQSTYKEVPLSEVTSKNPKLAAGLQSSDASSILTSHDPNLVAMVKSEPVPMRKMSDLGYPLDKEVKITDPWGTTQTKPAGKDAYLVFDKTKNKYYMVNADEHGLPIDYVHSAVSKPPVITAANVGTEASKVHEAWMSANGALQTAHPELFVDYNKLSAAERMNSVNTLIQDAKAAGQPTQALETYLRTLKVQATSDSAGAALTVASSAATKAKEVMEIPTEMAAKANERLGLWLETHVPGDAGKVSGNVARTPAQAMTWYSNTVESSMARFSGKAKQLEVIQTQAVKAAEEAKEGLEVATRTGNKSAIENATARVKAAEENLAQADQRFHVEKLRDLKKDFADDMVRKAMDTAKQGGTTLSKAEITKIRDLGMTSGSQEQAKNLMISFRAMEVLKASPGVAEAEFGHKLAPTLHEAWQSARSATHADIDQWIKNQSLTASTMSPAERQLFEKIESGVKAGDYPKNLPQIKPDNASKVFSFGSQAVDIANTDYTKLPAFWKNENASAAKNVFTSLTRASAKDPTLSSPLFDQVSQALKGSPDSEALSRIASVFSKHEATKAVESDPMMSAAADEFAKWQKRSGVTYDGPAGAVVFFQTIDDGSDVFTEAKEKKEKVEKRLGMGEESEGGEKSAGEEASKPSEKTD